MNHSDQVTPHQVQRRVPQVLCGSIAAVLALVCLQSSALALPSGGQLVAGKGSIETNGKSMTVTAGDRSIFNFTKFNISSDEKVQFVQPSKSSSTLARATDGTPSEIFGRLESNGRLVFANAAGIYFRSGSSVSVGGLVAAAGNISDDEFQKGSELAGSAWYRADLTGRVENAGQIESTGGVALLGKNVVNSGSIVAPNGTVTLIADDSVIVTELGSDIAVERNSQIFLDDTVAVDSNINKESVPKKALAKTREGVGVEHSGSITARSVFLGAGDIYAVGVRHTGKTKASSSVVVQAASKVEISGKIDVSSTEQAQIESPKSPDGAVESYAVSVLAPGISISGETVEIKGATLTANGNLQGGDIRVFGTDVSISADSVLDVSGTGKGNGGSISVDGFNSLALDGKLVARGGEDSGNGGQIYLNAPTESDFAPTLVTDVSAPKGKEGTVVKWDLNPIVVTDPGVVTDTNFVDGKSDENGSVIYYTLGGDRPVDLGGVFYRGKLVDSVVSMAIETGSTGVIPSVSREALGITKQSEKGLSLAKLSGDEGTVVGRVQSLAVGDAFAAGVFGVTDGVTGEATSVQQISGE